MADEDASGYRWLSEYEKTWEVLQEDDDGSLQATIDDIIHKAKRKRLAVRKGNVRLGMMRHLFLIVDHSKAMTESDLLRPSRIACTEKLLEKFLMEYFDQNPISQIGMIITKNKRAEKVTDLSGNPKMHLTALRDAVDKGAVGEPSLQNSLDTAMNILKHLPNHASKEVLIIFGSLTTCDPGDIDDTIQALKNQDIRCSVVGLSAEIHICKKICKETSGSYGVILDEKHFQDLLMEHVRPPETKILPTSDEMTYCNCHFVWKLSLNFITEFAFQKAIEASLIRMGFPTHRTDGPVSLCECHIDSKDCAVGLGSIGYFCPQCRSKYCELPVECKICGLTLVSAPHLARSYQHLFPLAAFKEIDLKTMPKEDLRKCKGCQRFLTEQTLYQCSKCSETFCNDCDMFIHETLHACPGCTSCTAPRLMSHTSIANGS
eukprot:gene15252-16827_t